MKSLYKSLSLTAVTTILLSACESDLEKSYYNSSTAQPAVLEAIQDVYTVNNLKQEENAVTFKWTPANVGYQASVTNNLEMDIKGENNFGDKKVVLYSNAGKTTEVSFTNKDLNDQIYTLLKNYAGEDGSISLGSTPLQFRVTSTISSTKSPLISNIIDSNITPYNNDVAGYKSAVLSELGSGEIALDETKKDEAAFNLNWQSAYMGDNVSITYKIEANLPENNESYNILKKATVGTVKNDNSLQVTHQSMNNALMELLNKYNMPVDENGTDLEFFITSTKSGYPVAIVSNKIALKVKPFAYIPAIAVDATDGAYNFSWNTTEGAAYQIEMDTDENFSQRTVLASGINASEHSVSTENINKAVKYLKIAHGAQSPEGT